MTLFRTFVTTNQGVFEMLSPDFMTEIRAFTHQAGEQLSWTREQILAEQRRRLRKIIADAQRDSPFHADRMGQLEASKLELSDLERIPPMTKQDVMTHWDQLVTDRRLCLGDVTEHLRQSSTGEQQIVFYLNDYYASATGGSSGHRGVFVWDRETIVVTANVTYRMDARKDAEQSPPTPRRTAVICAGSLVHASRLLFPITIDPERTTRVFPADLRMGDMVAQLNEFQPDRIVGYASIVQELCEQAIDGRLNISPTQVSTNSEPLTSKARQLAMAAWGINIHNTWGSVETGVAATEGDSFEGMTLAEDFLIFEPVDHSYRPIPDSAVADRLLVTKLFGSVMPLIRYELTDTIIVDDGENPDARGFRRIAEMKGPADTWFTYPGDVRVHPMIFRDVLGQQPSIREYQVQQTAKGAHVLAVVDGHCSRESIVNRLTDALEHAGLASPEVSIQSVDQVPRHPQTNKVKRFLPLNGG